MAVIVPPVGALIARARRRIRGHFFAHHAVSPEDAVPYSPGSHTERRMFDHLRESGVVREASAGRYWFDVEAYQADLEGRRRRLIPIVIVLMLVAAAIPLFFYQG